MGCHTWFSRPITAEEFELMKQYAPTEIYNLTYNSDRVLYNFLMESYRKNIPCVDGLYWWELGYGSGNPKLLNGSAFIHKINGKKGLFVDVPKYCDMFRVSSYSKKVISSRKELRQWMKKRYFELTDGQLEIVSKFFRENVGGVITFG